MNRHEQQDTCLQRLHCHRDSECFSAFLDWLQAHWQDAMDALSRPVNSDEELKWMHFQAVLFRTLLTELDERYLDEQNNR